MKTIGSCSISTRSDGSAIILERRGRMTKHLAFSPAYSRFMAICVYAEAEPVSAKAARQLPARLEKLQSRLTRGLAYPFEAGETEGLFFQTCALPEGRTLRQILQAKGSLPGPSLAAFGRALLRAARAAFEGAGVYPRVDPDAIVVSRAGTETWDCVFADYDLREPLGILPPPEGAPGEMQFLQELSLLLYQAGTGREEPWFYPLLNESFTPRERPELSLPVLQLFQNLFDQNTLQRPISLARMEHVISTFAGALTGARLKGLPPVERDFLTWLPAADAFPRPYVPSGRVENAAAPCTYLAADKLRESQPVVHLLPPDSMTGGPAQLSEDYRQSTPGCLPGPRHGLIPVESVMSDPAGRVIAERVTDGFTLAAWLDGSDQILTLSGWLGILERIDRRLDSTRAEGFTTLSLAPGDILIRPRLGTALENWDGQGDYEIWLRPFHGNLFTVDTPDLGPLRDPAHPGAPLQFFRRENGFVALAYLLAYRWEEVRKSGWPPHLTEVFRSAFRDSAKRRPLFLKQLRGH